MLKVRNHIFELFWIQLNQCWHGKKSLGVTFWLITFIGNFVFLTIIGDLFSKDFSGAWLFSVFVLVYFVFSIKSLWSCFIAYERKRILAIDTIIFCVILAVVSIGVRYYYSGDIVRIHQGEIVDHQWSSGKSGIHLAIVKLDSGKLEKAWCSHKKKGTKVTVEKRSNVFNKSSFKYACIGHFSDRRVIN